MGADNPGIESGITTGTADARLPIAEVKSEPGHRVFVGSSAGRGALEKIALGYEQLASFEEHRNQALSSLEQAGFLTRPEGETGPIVCDLQRFRTKGLQFKQLEKTMGPITNPKYGDSGVISVMTRVFRDLSVFSRDDYSRLQKGEKIDPKPLFYIPKNANEALAESKAKTADYHLGLWELKTKLPKQYPTQEGGKAVSTHEAVIMQLVFNTHFGKAFRQDYGRKQLVVSYPDGTRRPISANFFREWKYGGNPIPADKSKPSHNPKEFLTDHCPTIVKKGLIRPENDFRLLSGIGTTGERFTQPRKPNKKGLVTVQGTGMRYNLTSQFGNGEYLVYKLSDAFAGIVHTEKDGPRTPVSIFGLEPTNALKVTRRPENAAKVTDVRKGAFPVYEKDAFITNNPDTATVFNQFDQYHDFCVRASSEAKVNLTMLPLRDQSYALQMYDQYRDDPRFWKLLKDEQYSGLKTLIIGARSGKGPEAALSLHGHPLSRGLYDEAAKIYDSISEYEKLVRDTLPPRIQEQADEFTTIALKHTQSLLDAGVSAIDQTKSRFTLTDATLGLRLSRDRIYRIFHTSYGLHEQDEAAQLILSQLSNSQNHPGDKALAMELFEQSLLTDIRASGSMAAQEAVKEAFHFYHQNEELYESVSQTTGDTAREQQNFSDYVTKRERMGKPLGKTLLDLGTGEQGRMASFIHKTSPDTHVVGIDLVQPHVTPEAGLTMARADITHIPLADSMVDDATAFWSVYNDLSQEQRLQLTAELRRVMRVGGHVYIGTPHLEGGEGSWMTFSQEYHKTHRDKPVGTIEATIAGRKKTFFILPEAEIRAEFERDGFTLIDSVEWRTQTGKPRKDYIFELTSKQTPYSR